MPWWNHGGINPSGPIGYLYGWYRMIISIYRCVRAHMRVFAYAYVKTHVKCVDMCMYVYIYIYILYTFIYVYISISMSISIYVTKYLPMNTQTTCYVFCKNTCTMYKCSLLASVHTHLTAFESTSFTTDSGYLQWLLCRDRVSACNRIRISTYIEYSRIDTCVSICWVSMYAYSCLSYHTHT